MKARPRTYDVLGLLLKFHAFPADVQDKYCLVEALVPPGGGAPMNQHAGETECFYVLGGRIEFTVADQTRIAGAGEYVPIPDGAPHAFRAIGDAPARVLILNAPGHMHEVFFTGVGEVLPEDQVELPAPREPDLAHLTATAAAAGMTFLRPESD